MLTTKVKLGIVTLFACLSILLLSLVAPKASAAYQDGDFSPYTPQQLYNIADQRLYNTYSEHIGSKWFICIWDVSSSSFTCRVWGTKEVNTYTFTGNINSSNRAKSSQGCCRVTFTVNRSNGNTSSYTVEKTTNNGSSYYYLDNDDIQHIYCNDCTVIWGNGSASPAVQYSDYLNILDKQLSGFEVYACVTENSRFSGWWGYTNKYILKVSGTYNNQPFTITYPNYPAYFMTTRIEEYQWNVVDDEYVNIIIPDPYSSPSPFIQNIAYVPDITVDGISSPELNYSSSWVHTGYDNAMAVGLNSLLNACKEYLNDDTLTDDFLWQGWTVSLVGYSDNRTYYSIILDYSVYDEGTVPDPDPTDIDWYSSLDQILQTINNNQMYNYLNTPPIGYKKVGYVGQFGTLTTVTDPNFDFQPIEGLDTDAMGFFSWLVNLIVDSPVGVLMLFALTFLVVSAVIK